MNQSYVRFECIKCLFVYLLMYDKKKCIEVFATDSLFISFRDISHTYLENISINTNMKWTPFKTGINLRMTKQTGKRLKKRTQIWVPIFFNGHWFANHVSIKNKLKKNRTQIWVRMFFNGHKLAFDVMMGHIFEK